MDLSNRNSFTRGFEIGVSKTVRFLFHQLSNKFILSHSGTQVLHKMWHISSYIKEILVFKIYRDIYLDKAHLNHSIVYIFLNWYKNSFCSFFIKEFSFFFIYKSNAYFIYNSQCYRHIKVFYNPNLQRDPSWFLDLFIYFFFFTKLGSSCTQRLGNTFFSFVLVIISIFLMVV